MSDNVVLNPGVAGKTVATDDVGGVQHQRVKIEVGADGTATQVSGGAGVTDDGTVRVVLPTDQTAIPVSSTTLATAAKQPALGTAGTPSADVITTQPPVLSLATDFGTVTKANIKNSAGHVYVVKAFNANAAVRYLQLHNKATAPAGTNVPLLAYPIPAGTTNNPGAVVLGPSDLGYAFGTGIGWAISTTLATFTDSATAGEHSVEIGYL